MHRLRFFCELYPGSTIKQNRKNTGPPPDPSCSFSSGNTVRLKEHALIINKQRIVIQHIEIIAEYIALHIEGYRQNFIRGKPQLRSLRFKVLGKLFRRIGLLYVPLLGQVDRLAVVQEDAVLVVQGDAEIAVDIFLRQGLGICRAPA